MGADTSTATRNALMPAVQMAMDDVRIQHDFIINVGVLWNWDTQGKSRAGGGGQKRCTLLYSMVRRGE